MTGRRWSRERVEFGDWQTPVALAQAVVSHVSASGFKPASIVEPTCGEGSFLIASQRQWPNAELMGFDVNDAYVATARAALKGSGRVVVADFFNTPWESKFSGLPGPVLVIGNPPWVTASALGRLESRNIPKKANVKQFAGLDAITGKANFDVSEWMVLRLLHALSDRQFVLCLLCKAIVARRVMERVAVNEWRISGSLRAIDAMRHFGAAVDAVVLTLTSDAVPGTMHAVRWPFYPSLTASKPSRHLGYTNGTSSPNIDAYLHTQQLAGTCKPEWRSGLKHDCSAVMELTRTAGTWTRRSGERVDIEDTLLFPLMKGSDVANGRWPPTRGVIVTQRHLGEPTSRVQHIAPNTWAYLTTHTAALDSRKSSIYKNQPRFAVFGVGEYTFAPWKIAIAGLYKRLAFTVIPPFEGRPVVVDDTVYVLSFQSESQARAAHAALTSEQATAFFNARIFWEDKRPINKKVLQSLDLQGLMAALGLTHQALPRQGSLFEQPCERQPSPKAAHSKSPSHPP